MLIIFLPVTLIPLAIAGILGGVITYQRSSEQKEAQLHDRAIIVAELTSKKLEFESAILQTAATDPLIINAVRSASQEIKQEGLEKKSVTELENQFKENKLLNVNQLLNSYLQRLVKLGNFTDIFFTEQHGFNIASSKPTPDLIQRNKAWWKKAKKLQNSETFITPPHPHKSANTLYFDLINKIVDPKTGQFLGVIKAGYRAKDLNFLAEELHKIELLGSEHLQIISIADGKNPMVVTTMNRAKNNKKLHSTKLANISSQKVLGGDVLLQHAMRYQSRPQNSGPYTKSFIYNDRRFTLARVPGRNWIVVASIELAEIHKSAKQILLMFGLIFLVLATVASIIIVKFSRTLSDPLNLLTMTARKVTEICDFTLRVPVTTQDEVGMLAIHFNRLIRWIEKYIQELQETQAQLIHSEKMSSLGQMLAGVVHEINNPVNFVHGNIQHAGEYSQDLLKIIQIYQENCPNLSSEVQERIEDMDPDFVSRDFPKLLNSMQVGTERIIGIVNSLRTFSRLDEADVKQADIHEGIDSTLVILQSRLKDNKSSPTIQIIKDYGDIPSVECCPGQINQVFMNILANAIDAYKESPQLKDSDGTEAIKNREKPKITLQTRHEGKNCIITISDNGSGMSPEVKRRIFDPFFTTKSVGQGTGLGLSISYKIVVEKHKGKLECDSIVGHGTKFTITLPIEAAIEPQEKLLI
ncbi:MAG: ATP-binding protein [Mastigocoleus sp. MO_188.B34]|nr:ATP-binding protein [Mastigocoleus sp. MO_188.B34]